MRAVPGRRLRGHFWYRGSHRYGWLVLSTRAFPSWLVARVHEPKGRGEGGKCACGARRQMLVCEHPTQILNEADFEGAH